MTENDVTTAQPLTVPMWRYLWWFLGASIVMNIVVGILGAVIGGSGLGSVSMLVPYFAAMLTADRFIGDHLRVPTRDEKWWLIWWSFGVTVAWAVVAGGILLLASGGDPGGFLDEIGVGALAAIAAVTLIVSFVLLLAAYSFWPKRSLRNRLRQQERLAAKEAEKARRQD
ncbi:ABZJ_00895 family protein [Gordonia sp. (in: high G+C Gram-positive bacteria)]|uniref:ABZJ_00895 family protein n=1 Tax=Gordonia sp. (in: high G+C Gram-positive bacteria) TaxID=84139 RepID=UPI0039E68A90